MAKPATDDPNNLRALIAETVGAVVRELREEGNLSQRMEAARLKALEDVKPFAEVLDADDIAAAMDTEIEVSLRPQYAVIKHRGLESEETLWGPRRLRLTFREANERRVGLNEFDRLVKTVDALELREAKHRQVWANGDRPVEPVSVRDMLRAAGRLDPKTRRPWKPNPAALW